MPACQHAHTQAPDLGGGEIDLHAHPRAIGGREARLAQRRASEQRGARPTAQARSGRRRADAERRRRGRKEGARAAQEAQEQQSSPHSCAPHGLLSQRQKTV